MKSPATRRRKTTWTLADGSALAFQQCMPAPTEDMVGGIEEYFELKLPQPYRRFLLTCNGGVPSRAMWKNRKATIEVSYFYSLHENHDRRGDLAEELHHFKLEGMFMPKNLIPIAADPHGNRVCLSVRGKDRGKVYFWDHEEASEEELENPHDYKDVELVAKSLDAFFAGLKCRRIVDGMSEFRNEQPRPLPPC